MFYFRQQQRQTQVKKATEKAKQEDSFIVCWGRRCSKGRCCIWAFVSTDKDKYKDREGFSKYVSEADVAFPWNQNRSSSVEVQLQVLHMLDLSCNCCASWIWADALADTFIAADAKGGGGGKIKHETTEQEKANTYISYFYLLPFFENIPLILNE